MPLLDLEGKGSPEPVEERLMDMPNRSPGRKVEIPDPQPVYKPKHTQRRHFHDDDARQPPRGEPNIPDKRVPKQDNRRNMDVDRAPEPPVEARAPEPAKEREGRRMDRGPRPTKGDRHMRLSKDDSFIKDNREKYQWYNERRLSPPLEVKRSRSLSPPALTLDELHREIEAKRRELQVDT